MTRHANPTAANSLSRLEACLARITAEPEGAILFRSLYPEAARADAAASDARRAAGRPLSAIDGVIVSIKDLLDVAGEPTTAGSSLLLEAAPAARDAEVVRRLRRAGAVIIGKTHMTEFAFSAVGANPHFGTPGNPADPSRITGGSSSGAAAALMRGMCEMSVGSDTGGSIRIPAALCGCSGLKPTQARIPLSGAQALSPSLDSLGAIAGSVADCAALDGVLAGQEGRTLDPARLAGLRVGVPAGYFHDGMEGEVAAAFDAALARLTAAGAVIEAVDLSEEMEAMTRVNARATFPNVESSHVFRAHMAGPRDRIDPFIRARIERGMGIEAAHYIWMCEERARLQQRFDRHFDAVDVLLTPTVPVLAPTIAEIADPDALARINLLLLRNTWAANFFDLPALSLPCQQEGLPVGLQIIGPRAADARVLAVGLAVEALLQKG